MTNQEAIEILEGLAVPINAEAAFDMAIEALKKQEEQRWIPVSERLPEDGTEVFVYLFDRPSPFIAWIEDTCWYTEDFEVDWENEPIAWMPLPEPYKEGDNDE